MREDNNLFIYLMIYIMTLGFTIGLLLDFGLKGILFIMLLCLLKRLKNILIKLSKELN